MIPKSFVSSFSENFLVFVPLLVGNVATNEIMVYGPQSHVGLKFALEDGSVVRVTASSNESRNRITTL